MSYNGIAKSSEQIQNMYFKQSLLSQNEEVVLLEAEKIVKEKQEEYILDQFEHGFKKSEYIRSEPSQKSRTAVPRPMSRAIVTKTDTQMDLDSARD